LRIWQSSQGAIPPMNIAMRTTCPLDAMLAMDGIKQIL